MNKSRSIAIYALMTALVAVLTFALKIPTVATEGYLNLGDGMLLFCGVAFGPIAGGIAGGIGSALADLIAGYAHWMLPTFLIKGAEGALAGLLFSLLKKSPMNRFLSAGIAMVPAALLMVVGYFFASWIMKGNAAVAWTSVPGNAVQGSVGVALALFLLFNTSRIKNISAIVGKNQFYILKPIPSRAESDGEKASEQKEESSEEDSDPS